MSLRCSDLRPASSGPLAARSSSGAFSRTVSVVFADPSAVFCIWYVYSSRYVRTRMRSFLHYRTSWRQSSRLCSRRQYWKAQRSVRYLKGDRYMKIPLPVAPYNLRRPKPVRAGVHASLKTFAGPCDFAAPHNRPDRRPSPEKL